MTAWLRRHTARLSFWRLPLSHDERGTAVLELGIMLPPLLLLGLSVMEIGNLMYKRHLIENGVRDAARYVAGQACDANAIQRAVNIASRGTVDTTGSLRVSGWQLETGDITCAIVNDTYSGTKLRGGFIGGSCSATPPAGCLRVVRVTESVTYGDIDIGMLQILSRLGVPFNDLNFNVRHEERYYGNR